MSSDQRLTFEQVEGTEPLPSQLQPETITQEMRARLWDVLYEAIRSHISDWHVRGWWAQAIKGIHVERLHLPADEFTTHHREAVDTVKAIVMKGGWAKVYGLVEWILRRPQCPTQLSTAIEKVLRECMSAYTIYDHDTVGRVATGVEAQAITKAFADTSATSFGGAHAHLKAAVQALTAGNNAASVRESITAVESVAKVIAPGSNDLGPALTALQKKHAIHGALGEGFKKLYGFTSDEKGIRHALLEKSEADVDEADAIYMLGACGAFVSYLIARANQ